MLSEYYTRIFTIVQGRLENALTCELACNLRMQTPRLFPRDNFDIMKYEHRLSGLISSAKRCSCDRRENEEHERVTTTISGTYRPHKCVASGCVCTRDTWILRWGWAHLLRASRVVMLDSGLSGISRGAILVLNAGTFRTSWTVSYTSFANNAHFPPPTEKSQPWG